MSVDELGSGADLAHWDRGEVARAGVVDEVRRWTRFSDERLHASVTTDEGTREVEVLDESFGGIGIETDRRGDFETGLEVLVQYRTGPMAGTICFLKEEANGKVRAGIEWRKPPRPYL